MNIRDFNLVGDQSINADRDTTVELKQIIRRQIESSREEEWVADDQRGGLFYHTRL